MKVLGRDILVEDEGGTRDTEERGKVGREVACQTPGGERESKERKKAKEGKEWGGKKGQGWKG